MNMRTVFLIGLAALGIIALFVNPLLGTSLMLIAGFFSLYSVINWAEQDKVERAQQAEAAANAPPPTAMPELHPHHEADAYPDLEGDHRIFTNLD